MEVGEQIKRFEDFIQANYFKELNERVSKGDKSIVFDFVELTKHDPDLAELLLEQPEEVIRAAEIALSNFDLPKDAKNIRVRISNITPDLKMLIRNIRSEHLGRLMMIDGVVRQKSDVRPRVTSARFECPSCGNVINVLQLDSKFKEPSRCGCGRKGKFKLLKKELVDAQGIVLEEATKDLEGGEQPKRINVLLKDDLVSPISEKRTNPGSNIRVVGIVKEVPIILRSGGLSTKFDIVVEGNFVEPLEEDYSNIEISPEEKEMIEELASDKRILERLSKSLAPGIYGHDRIKEALILQFCGGVRKMRDDGVSTRGDIHILLIGDPGAGKSQLLKRATIVAPKSRYVSGKGVSGAGLTASVVKDEFLHGWSLEAGALVLANKGVVMIDEMDKMGKEDRDAMHEALEQQTVSISKANIQATLRCETTVLAAANPKFGRFDPYETISKQIDLPPTLINRFDLIFTIKDMPDQDKDEKMAKFILNLHQQADGNYTKKENVQDDMIPTDVLRKYLIYCRQVKTPLLTDAALEELKIYYVKMRTSGSDEAGAMKSIPISARQLEALVRLAEATAKARLSDRVTRKDAKRAIALLHYCLEQVGLDPETGKIDIDRISTGIPSTERNKIATIREIISELEEKIGKAIPMEEITAAATEKGLSESDTEEAIEKLRRVGDVFMPRHGFISRI
ncbi:minichromosome maintenance protein MCM [Candidatus Woesearchaeota archaeon]|nr:minichromosome maintenance protein MCM [Candidatus Woesearchaeota archaeon]